MPSSMLFRTRQSHGDAKEGAWGASSDGRGRADSGLGGRLVEGFAQQLGGQVERESGNQGMTVRLILPLRDDSGSLALTRMDLGLLSKRDSLNIPIDASAAPGVGDQTVNG
jgi:hypothetical protein